jgi:hypothetical protein
MGEMRSETEADAAPNQPEIEINPDQVLWKKVNSGHSSAIVAIL